jgi:hypothetical protein
MPVERPAVARMNVRDYKPLLERAIAEAKAAGLEAEARELEAALNGVYTTSGEVLVEHAIAMRRFLADTRGRAPPEVARKVRDCLNETQLAWPGWQQLLARLRRPKTLG